MEWFEKVKDTAAKTVEIAKEKSGELYEVTKLSFSINELETKIDKLFKNAGMLVYRDYENGAEISDDIKMLMEDVDVKFGEISNIKAEINRIKNVTICSKCQRSNPNDANYCIGCGEKLN